MDNRKIFEQMLIDDEEVLQRVVGKAKRVFNLDRSGNVIFRVSKSKLTQRQQVAMQLLARYIASELSIADSDLMTANELAESLTADTPSVSARLHELKQQRVAESPERGHFRISILGVEGVLDEILSEE
jgi:hypothetical protein